MISKETFFSLLKAQEMTAIDKNLGAKRVNKKNNAAKQTVGAGVKKREFNIALQIDGKLAGGEKK